MERNQPTQRGLIDLLNRELALYGRAAVGSSLAFWKLAAGVGAGFRAERSQDLSCTVSSGDGERSARSVWEGVPMALAFGTMEAIERFGLALDVDGAADREGRAPVLKQQQVQDQTVVLPARVHEASMGLVTYTASLRAVRKVLEDEGCPFEPLDLGRGRTAIGVFLVAYRGSDLGVYDELGISCTIRPCGRPDMPVGRYIRHLFVNQTFTRDAGREIWGYPKEIYDLHLGLDANRARCTMLDGGRRLLSLEMPRGRPASTSAFTIRDYTLLRGRPKSTTLELRVSGLHFRMGGQGISLSLGATSDHSACAFLGSIDLADEPLAQLWCEHASGALSAPRPLRL